MDGAMYLDESNSLNFPQGEYSRPLSLQSDMEISQGREKLFVWRYSTDVKLGKGS